MIGLRSAVKRSQQVVPLVTEVEFVEHAASRWSNPAVEMLVGESHFGPAVKGVVGTDRLDPLASAALGSVEGVLCGDQLPIDRIAEMGQVDTTEGPMPVGTVALAPIGRRHRLVIGLTVDRAGGT